MAEKGTDFSERTKWTRADAKAFGGMPAGAEPTMGHRAANAAQGAANTLRDGYNYSVGNDRHFGPQQKPVGAVAHVKDFAKNTGKALIGQSPKANAFLAGAARATKEAGDVNKVLTSPTATNYDKAAQVAESTGSVAGTAAGAYTGWKSGTALGALGGGLFGGGVGAGPGAAVGGLIGGGLGAYYGGEAVDAVVNKLRGMFGLDTTSTVDRVAAQDVAAKDATADQPETKTDARNPYADQNQAKLEAFALAEKQRAESEQLRQMGESYESRPGANGARPDLGYGAIADRTQLTNARAAEMNPAGVIKVTKGANGNPEFSGMDLRGQVSYANADGKALPGGGWDGKGFSSFSVAPAGSNVVLGPNGSYAYATSGSGTRSAEQLQQDIASSKQQVAAQAQRLGVDIAGLSPAQALKYMGEVENARSINAAGAAQAAAYDRSGKWMNDLLDPRTQALRNASVGPTIFRNRRERDAAMRERQKNYENTWNLVAGAPDREATRELEYTKSANTLRGQQMSAEAQMYSSDNTLRGNMYQSDLTAATAAQKAEADRKAAAHTQAKDSTAAQKAAREETVNMFRREGDKDIGAAEQRVNVADQILPGFSTMDTASKARARPTVDSAVDLFDRMKAQTPQGMWEKLTSSDKPGLTGLPLIKGWKVDRSFGGDHYITNPKTKQTITLGSGLNEMQIKMLENATQSGSFLPPKNK